jgi:putative SOS response-associated peptidase YedK
MRKRVLKICWSGGVASYPRAVFTSGGKEGREKVPMRFKLKSGEPFAFVGLWDFWRKPDGRFLNTFAIVTTEPNNLVRPIHDRMPVMLDDDDALKWLACDGEISHALSLLKPYLSVAMEAYAVSRLVNDPRNDSAKCIDPAAQETSGMLF